MKQWLIETGGKMISAWTKFENPTEEHMFITGLVTFIVLCAFLVFMVTTLLILLVKWYREVPSVKAEELRIKKCPCRLNQENKERKA